MTYRVLLLQPDGWRLVWTCFSRRSALELAREIDRNTRKLVAIDPPVYEDFGWDYEDRP